MKLRIEWLISFEDFRVCFLSCGYNLVWLLWCSNSVL